MNRFDCAIPEVKCEFLNELTGECKWNESCVHLVDDLPPINIENGE